jgi:hypothetical protein
MGEDELYVNNIHPEDAKKIDDLTTPRNWDYEQFKIVLVALGTVGGGQAIPAKNRPNSIHLQNWRKHINDLVSRTRKNGREHARVVFVDKERHTLVFSGKITVGTATRTRLDMTSAPGRELYQAPIASIHSHPLDKRTLAAHGFSGQDYRTFLGDPRQQAMLITYGEKNVMMILKTSVTPNNMSEASINRRIANCEEEFLTSSKSHPLEKIVAFNKTVCMETGLTLYVADENSRDLFNRVSVTT